MIRLSITLLAVAAAVFGYSVGLRIAGNIVDKAMLGGGNVGDKEPRIGNRGITAHLSNSAPHRCGL